MTTYIAEQVKVDVMGVEFVSFRLENGEVVYSIRGAATGLGVPISTFMKYRDNLPEKIKGKEVITTEGYKTLKPLLSKASEPFTLKAHSSGNAINTINVVTKEELIGWVLLFAEVGQTRCQAMKDAGFVVAFQIAEDRAYGVTRTPDEYHTMSTEARKFAEEQRAKLRMTTQQLTKKILGPRVFTPNNEFIYGDGKTRDTYEGLDAGLKHHLLNATELIEVGAKLAWRTLTESIDLAHNHMKTVMPEIVD